MPLLPAAISRALAVPATPVARLTAIGGLPKVVRDRFDIPWSAADRRAYGAIVLAARTLGRVIPDRVSTPVHMFLLKRAGAATERASVG